MTDRPHHERLLEAVIFASRDPVPLRTLATLLPDGADLDITLAAITARHAGGGFELYAVGQGVMFRSAPDLAPDLRRVVEVPRRLPRAAMETLAVIAYHQPVTRAEIEEFRGVSLSQNTLDALLEADLVAPAGQREAPGRPTLWATTPHFLAQFGLKSLRDLPKRSDLLVEPVTPMPELIPPDP
jgi:segregation and condensation protein B